MKSIVIAFLLTALAGRGIAQPISAEGQQNTIGTQRAAISVERARLEKSFLMEDAACYKKFAVNNCLGNVNARRRQPMEDLRRQEILLNDEERKIKGAEQIRTTEEKTSPEKRQEAVDRNASAIEDHELRLEREKNKKQERAITQSNEKTARNANAEKLLRNQKKAVERDRKQAAAADQVGKYADRQNEAQKRRADHEVEKMKQAKPPPKSLPVPDL